MESFEGVQFGPDEDLDLLVADQLQTGQRRGRGDFHPEDWLHRALSRLSRENKKRLVEAIHNALLNPSAAVRIGALRLLSVNSRIRLPEKLVDIAIYHFDLFEGLRGGSDREVDYGEELLIVAANCYGSRARIFRREKIFEAEYGACVLGGLIRYDSGWLVDHISEIVAPSLDPEGERLNAVFFLMDDKERLAQLVERLVKERPELAGRLEAGLTAENIDDLETLARLRLLIPGARS